MTVKDTVAAFAGIVTDDGAFRALLLLVKIRIEKLAPTTRLTVTEHVVLPPSRRLRTLQFRDEIEIGSANDRDADWELAPSVAVTVALTPAVAALALAVNVAVDEPDPIVTVAGTVK